jgi:hypothetical protein
MLLALLALAMLDPIALDLSDQTHRQVVVDREPGQYLGHPSAVLLEDGRTILCVYPKGHGKGAIVLKRSEDGGRTWSERLPTPTDWATSQETPTIHRVIDAKGTKRLVLFSGLYPARMAVSEDDGRSWSELNPLGDWGGIVVMGSVVPLRTGPGRYLAMFHDDGRFFHAAGRSTGIFTLFRTTSEDGGLTWSRPEPILARSDVHLCEPGVFRTRDGSTLAALLRENRRVKRSHLILSRDEGMTWSDPKELPGSLTGDRHSVVVTADGRLFVSFRDMAKNSPTWGDWIAWVGTEEDILRGHDGQYRVRLKDNHVKADCAYPALVLLPDQTIVAITYGHWTPDESPYLLSVRLRLADCDRLAHREPASRTELRTTPDQDRGGSVGGPPGRAVGRPDFR